MEIHGREKLKESGDNVASTTDRGKGSDTSASCADDVKTHVGPRKINAGSIPGGDSDSELSSFATSSICSKQHNKHWFQLPRSQRAPPQDPSLCSSSSGSGNNEGSNSSSSSSECGDSICCSMPESEAFWSDLPAMKPLINPSRLHALRLCSRDSRTHDSGEATMRANPMSPESRLTGVDDQQHLRQLEQTGRPESYTETLTCQSQQTLQMVHIGADFNQCNSRSRAGRSKDEASVDGGAPEELLMAESASYPRKAIYQYSFRVPDTKTSMRPFSDPTDRRVEAIARACDSEILLDPEPIRPVVSSAIRLRRVTIRAPDQHSLEKCCRMFDDKFPQFYVSGGLGPGGRGVSKVFDDADEKYISASHNECN